MITINLFQIHIFVQRIKLLSLLSDMGWCTAWCSQLWLKVDKEGDECDTENFKTEQGED